MALMSFLPLSHHYRYIWVPRKRLVSQVLDLAKFGHGVADIYIDRLEVIIVDVYVQLKRT